MEASQKMIPLGVEDYKELVTFGYCYADKTLFIKDVIECGNKVMLFTRPRRFGKSLNLSMLKYFFNIDGSGKGLFDDCALARSANPHFEEQGKYPVISISLKDMRQRKLEDAHRQFCIAVRNVFLDFRYLLESKQILPRDKKLMQQIIDDEASVSDCANSILELTRMLYEHHGRDTVILIDEYDVPLDSGFVYGYYDEALTIVRTLLSTSCKSNPHLRLAVHTGCLRIAGESIYTGFNNPYINTILDNAFSNYFGFTPEEVKAILDSYNLGDMMPRVKAWYDGYLFGGQDIYNPWSILNCVQRARKNPAKAIAPYWTNTSGNDLLLNLFDCTLDGGTTRNDIERLLEGEPVTHAINENISYKGLRLDRDAIWNILFFTGYLKTTEDIDYENDPYDVPLVLVNKEIQLIVKRKINEWYARLSSTGQVLPLVKALESGNVQAVEVEVNKLLRRTVSFRDRAENFYHGFLAGLLAAVEGCRCLSNREDGEGISDIRVERLDRSAGVVIEVKMAESLEDMPAKAELGLKQAIETGYGDEYRIQEYGTVQVYGIACFGKQCKVRKQEENS